jgi:cytochrome P450
VLRDYVGFMDRCLKRYGDTFTVRFVGMGKLVYVAHPAAIKEVFTGDPEVLHAGEANALMEPVLGPNSVLLLDERPHMRQRRLLLPAFHGDSIRRYAELIGEVARREVGSWPLGRAFPLRPRMQAVTLEVILRAVFGIREAARLERLRILLPDLVERASVVMWFPWLRRDLGPGSPWRRFVRVRAAVDGLLYDEIRRRRAVTADGDDVLSMLLRARDEDGAEMTDAELRDELMTMVVAGHETTATGLSWALELLLRHPESLERLEADLAEGSDSYLDAVVRETLRVRPVVPDVGRVLAAPMTIGGWDLPTGVYVVPGITAVHRRDDLYPEPHAFRPERFLDGQPESYGWIPFGGGTRRCIGASFAQLEMKVVLRTILASARLAAEGDRPERMKLQNVTLVPARGARARLVERRPAPVAAGPPKASESGRVGAGAA